MPVVLRIVVEFRRRSRRVGGPTGNGLGQLARTLCSTNPCESMIEIVRYRRLSVAPIAVYLTPGPLWLLAADDGCPTSESAERSCLREPIDDFAAITAVNLAGFFHITQQA